MVGGSRPLNVPRIVFVHRVRKLAVGAYLAERDPTASPYVSGYGPPEKAAPRTSPQGPTRRPRTQEQSRTVHGNGLGRRFAG
eukprot:8823280-Pyramimonas_sp.AAC.1